jgi:prolyl-tRNA synthetase
MVHSDDDGLILPPKVAPIQIIILPIIHKKEDEEIILSYCKNIANKLKSQNIRVEIDLKEKSNGEKIWGWIKKGVPLRIEIGAKEVTNNSVFMARRDKAPNEKETIEINKFIENAAKLLTEMQDGLFKKAKNFQEEHTITVSSREEFYQFFSQDAEKSGFVMAHWIGDDKTEGQLKQELKVTARCIPLKSKKSLGKCIFTDQENAPLTMFARAY